MPIRFKILAMLGILLVGAVILYTWLASTIFRQEKTALLYDINHSTAVNTAAQLRSLLTQSGNVLRFYALSELNRQAAFGLSRESLKESHILSTLLFAKGDPNFRGLASQNSFAGNQNALRVELKQLDTSPYAFWIDTTNTPPKSFLATSLKLNRQGTQDEYIAVAELDTEDILSTLQSSTLFESFLMRKDGKVLLRGNRNGMGLGDPQNPHPITRELNSQQTSHSGVSTYFFEDTQWYGGYAPLGIADLFLVSQASQSQMNNALEVLVKRSLLFGLIAITATFLISVLFSRGLTKNLHRLTESAQRIGKGDLSSKIEVHSGDEVQTLALTFNQMIDALKESREAIERHNRELEHKVAERTQELREKNLAIEEIQDKLVKSAQLAAAGEVAGRTAHEVLNPLTAIVGRMERVDQYVNNREANPAEQFLDILTAWEQDYQKGGMKKLVEALGTPSKVLKNASLFEEDLTNLKQLALYWMQQQEQLGGDIHFVKDQAGRIQRIVDGMRELVRSSTMKDEVPCHAAIGEAVLTLQDIVEKAGVKLQTQLDAERDGAHLNRDELIQVLTNLIRNAFQALKQNKIQDAVIRVETHNEDNQLFIDIIDNGKGIAPSQKEKIFEQGFTTKPPAEGTGLGLSIARRYARAFGGDVVLAYSAPNDGTCFRVIVPLLDSPALSKAS